MTAEDDLAPDRARLDLVLAHSRDAIALQRGRTVEWCSPTVVDILGYPADQLVGMRLTDLLHSDDVAAATEAQALLAAGEPASLCVRLRHRDGPWRWVDMRVAPLGEVGDADGLLVANLRSVDAELAALAVLDATRVALAESEQRYRLVCDSARVAITVTVDGVLQWASPAIASIFGEPGDELVGVRVGDRVHPDDRPAFDAARRLVMGRTGEAPPVLVRVRARHLDGTWHWVELSIGPFAGDDGVISGSVTSWRLVDEQVAYTEALERSEARTRELASDLQRALESRIVIEQAKGIVAAHRDIGVDDAFVVLRAHARSRGLKLQDTARAVVELGLRP